MHTTYFKQDMNDHISGEHKIHLLMESFQFKTETEFYIWKKSVEKEEGCTFIKSRGTKVIQLGKKLTFICSRSGHFNSKSNGVRHLKIQGSKKINSYCPAGIEFIFNGDLYNVKYIKTHVGHTHELAHINLTDDDRLTIAKKLAMNIPMKSILNEIRDNISSESLDRIDLLTMKDIYNIEAAYNLQSSAVRHQNDAVSVDSFVREMQDQNSIVLLYKPQDTVLEEYPELKYSDFLLGIMNEGQLDILKKFGNDCICIDGTHGLNQYNFELHTLLVIDDLRQGFPCAFLFSNRSDEAVLKIFLRAIKSKIGNPIQPKVFMSDMADAYYNAWIQEMGEASHR